MTKSGFSEYTLPAPVYEDVAAEYGEIDRALDVAKSAGEAIAAVEKWDALRRRLVSWSTLVYIRFQQDTRNEEFKKAREYRDHLDPKLTSLAATMKRRLLASPHREALEARFGSHPFDLWHCDVAAFEPAIEADLVEQAKLEASYTALVATAKFELGGKSLTLEELKGYGEQPDREVRHEAARLRWGWFGENREKFDAIFDGLVRLRHTMARKLSYEDFVGLGYQRMQRVGYGPAEVERFRAQVREVVVPLAIEIRERQAERLGVDPLMIWDEDLHIPEGNPRPLGGHDWMMERAGEMFERLDPSMDKLFREMRNRGLMDFANREGKGGGGFCDVVASYGLPFIFGSFIGTKQDVMVFTHEMGHAFQCSLGLRGPLWEFVFPTCETCEIHSMGLEFLSWPQMDLFFGEDGAKFRRLHLTTSLLFLPYGAAADQFQYLVYASPMASPDERAAMWQEMEGTYLPWRNWGKLVHGASGRMWQGQLHIYRFPFYYIDYALALTVALQLWELAARDRPAAMRIYLELCRRGGELAFGELVGSVGLVSPFAEGCLERVVGKVRRELERM